MNVYQVDESSEGEALIQNKLLVRLNKNGVPSDKYVFDFSADDTFEKDSIDKVNTKLTLHGEMPPGEEYIFYTRLTFIQRLQLGFRFERLWFQRKDNIQWLLNMLIAALAIYISWMAIIKNSNEKVIKLKIDNVQVDSLKNIFKGKNLELQKRIKIIEDKLDKIDTITAK